MGARLRGILSNDFDAGEAGSTPRVDEQATGVRQRLHVLIRDIDRSTGESGTGSVSGTGRSRARRRTGTRAHATTTILASGVIIVGVIGGVGSGALAGRGRTTNRTLARVNIRSLA
jgi:hypothetical protein